MKRYPGTVIQMTDKSGKEYLKSLFTDEKGLSMSQLNAITGVGTPTIQNWYQRGFVSRPVNKRYDIDQVARIFIINMLRFTTSLDDIKALLKYINGDTVSKNDDIISESVLYANVCNVVSSPEFNRFTVETLCEKATSSFNMDADSLERLQNTLVFICYRVLADEILDRGNNLLNKINCNEQNHCK